MPIGEPGRMQANINVTPLVDVVLVLLIIFMVVAPQMRPGPDIDLPDTAKPRQQEDDAARIHVTIDQRGDLWIEDQAVAAERFGDGLRAAAGSEPYTKVVIQGDARLPFGEVRQAMVAIEEAGFHGVALVAERSVGKARGGG